MSDYMTQKEVEQSARLGNLIARQITKGTPTKHNATIRHQLHTSGIHDATALACRLLGINHEDACKLVATLANSKSDDIVSPFYHL